MAEEEELVKAGWLRKKTSKKWKLCWYVLDMGDINNATFAHYEHRTMQRPRENDEAIDRLAQGRKTIKVSRDEVSEIILSLYRRASDHPVNRDHGVDTSRRDNGVQD